MIRLAMIQPEAAWWREVLELRLRGVSFSEGCEPTTDFDAILVIGLARVAVQSIAAWLEQGKHVMVSGRYCLSKSSLWTLCEAARRGGARLEIANPFRFSPSLRFIREQLATGKLGDVGLLRRHAWEPESLKDLPGHESPAVAMALDLDLLMWLVGKPVKRVFATMSRTDDECSLGMGSITAHLAFAGGAMALLSTTNSLPRNSYGSLSVIGSAGALYADADRNSQLLFGADEQIRMVGQDNMRIATMVQAFVDGLAVGQAVSACVEEWRRVLDVVEDVQRSLERETAISREEG